MAAEMTLLQQQHLATILGPDPAPFETLISHLMAASSNEQRSQAEILFNLCNKTDPDTLSLKLVHILQFSPAQEWRAMSAVLLRRLLTCDRLWWRLYAATQSTLKSTLLARIQLEEIKSVSKKLLPFMRNCLSSHSRRLKESAFLICAQIFQDLRDPREGFVLDVQELHTAFIRGLSIQSSADVKIAALKAVINFIHCSSPEDRGRFHDLLPAMMRALMDSPDNGTAREALQLFIELARTRTSFLKPQIVMVVGSMLQIAEVGSLEEGLRHLAIEFVMTLASKAPWMVRMQSQLISRLFAILMKMVLDMEDDPSRRHMSEDEDPGESGNHSFGQGCLDRLAILLGGYDIVPVASTYLAAPDWQKRHAALIALARIAEGSSKVMVIYLGQVVAMVLNSFQDPHPRVRCPL